MIFASEQVLKKQPCLVSVSLKGTDNLKPIVIKEIITCYRMSLDYRLIYTCPLGNSAVVLSLKAQSNINVPILFKSI